MVDLTVILPTYNRTRLLQRALDSIESQVTSATAEIFVYGDACPVLDQLQLTSSRFQLNVENLSPPNSGNPARAVNKAIDLSDSRYTIFLGDDDFLDPSHFENYLRFIETKPDLAFAYFNSVLLFDDSNHSRKGIRDAAVAWGRIGHSEIIVRTDILKLAPLHSSDYGHDWLLIDWLKDFPHEKATTSPPTYYVNWDVHRPKNYFG